MDEIIKLKYQIRNLKILVFLLLLFFCGMTAWNFIFSKPIVANAENTVLTNPRPLLSDSSFNGFEFKSFAIPSALDFCGESVPLNDFKVRERYDFEVMVTVYRNVTTPEGF